MRTWSRSLVALQIITKKSIKERWRNKPFFKFMLGFGDPVFKKDVSRSRDD
jgi:hypothetical protein